MKPLPSGRHAGGIAGVLILLVAATVVSAVIIVGPPSVPSPAARDVSAVQLTAAPSPSPPTAGTASAPPSCDAQAVELSASNRWLLYRAEFGARGGHDYLRLKLRRTGESDSATRVTAELVGMAEVAELSGLELPSLADAALMVQFDGPVAIPGRFGGRGRGALGEFTIARGQGGSTYVIAGVNGSGCFTITSGPTDSAESANQVDILIEIGRT